MPWANELQEAEKQRKIDEELAKHSYTSLFDFLAGVGKSRAAIYDKIWR
jgi:hypothetical protein